MYIKSKQKIYNVSLYDFYYYYTIVYNIYTFKTGAPVF
jgi:hypothetical protein